MSNRKLTKTEINNRLSKYNIKLIGQYTKAKNKTQFKCHCGKIFICVPWNIFCGDTKSCGCNSYNNVSKARLINLTGQTFGKLKVIRLIPKRQKRREYECLCECGNIKIILGENLSNGDSKSCGCISKERFTGKNNPRYNINLTDEDRQKRDYIKENKIWSSEILKRNNYICEVCEKHGGNLNAHHLDGYDWCVEKRLDLNNGICLCESCHRKFHKKYGFGKNTKEQFIEFIKTCK